MPVALMPTEGRPLQPKRSNANFEDSHEEYEGCRKRARLMQVDQPRATTALAREPVRERTSWVPVADQIGGALTMRRCVADFGQGILALQSGQLVQMAPGGKYYALCHTCIDEIS